VKAQIVTPSIAKPMAMIRKPPNPVNAFMMLNILFCFFIDIYIFLIMYSIIPYIMVGI
jgi:hypothetical protein